MSTASLVALRPRWLYGLPPCSIEDQAVQGYANRDISSDWEQGDPKGVAGSCVLIYLQASILCLTTFTEQDLHDMETCNALSAGSAFIRAIQGSLLRY